MIVINALRSWCRDVPGGTGRDGGSSHRLGDSARAVGDRQSGSLLRSRVSLSFQGILWNSSSQKIVARRCAEDERRARLRRNTRS